jgi:hypothetical protein
MLLRRVYAVCCKISRSEKYGNKGGYESETSQECKYWGEKLAKGTHDKWKQSQPDFKTKVQGF